MTQLELGIYPHAPGYKKEGTSADAASAMRSRAETVRERAFMALLRCPMTADEVAAKLGGTVLSIRPRLTELYRQNRIEESGVKRPNASGKFATVWRVK